MPGLGDELRAAREARRLSPSDVSSRIHIRSLYLENIEAEDWSAIGAPVYVRGFIRTYARFLGMDPERAVDYFNSSLVRRVPASGPAHEPVARRAQTRHQPSALLWLATAVAAILVVFVGYTAFRPVAGTGNRSPAAVVGVATPGGSVAPRAPVAARPASQAPVAAPPGSQARVSVSPAASRARGRGIPAASRQGGRRRTSRRLGVRLTQSSWLLVRVDGSKRLEGVFPAGTQKWFRGAHADVRAGNAGGVQLTVNGRRLGAMGRTGDVVERSLPLAQE